MKYLILFLSIFLFTGCATKWDVELQKSHDAKVVAQGQERTKRIQAVMDAFQIALVNAKDPMERAMIARSMEEIDTSVLVGKAPTLNTDNAGKVMDMAQGIAPFVVVGRVAEKSIENQQGNTINNNQDGTINIDGSLNREENHSTAIKDSNATLSKTGDQTTTTTDNSTDNSQ